MNSFDRYVAVDWSAAATPVSGANSIWIAVADRGEEVTCSNPTTRRRAFEQLQSLSNGSERTLIVVDASFGYPRGATAAFGLTGATPWRAWWETISAALTDDVSNRNNRFEVAADLNRRVGGPGPFWGCPAAAASGALTPTKPERFVVPEFRLVEERLRAGGRRPASVWQLLGAGSVGGQTLTLAPILLELLRAGAEVWPFTTGLQAPAVSPGTVVLAETWPTAFDLPFPIGVVRDAAQVEGVVRRLRSADEDGVLRSWFAPEIEPDWRAVIEAEEGWVLAPDAGSQTPSVRTLGV